jgi:hypothetical protein
MVVPTVPVMTDDDAVPDGYHGQGFELATDAETEWFWALQQNPKLAEVWETVMHLRERGLIGGPDDGARP